MHVFHTHRRRAARGWRGEKSALASDRNQEKQKWNLHLHPARTRRRLALLTFCLSIQILAFIVPGWKVSAATVNHQPAASSTNPNVVYLRQLIGQGKLASSVHVLEALAPTTLIQFPLVPSGLKQAFPKATGLVTIFRGNRDDSVSDTITVDVQNMPPNITFTIFLIQLANKPFGNVEYVADLTTRGDGSGETVFQCIALVAFAMDARNPGTSHERTENQTSGINLEHMGMWFSSLQDAQKVLNNDTLPGTIFDGGSPPLHAGPQAMTDGQTAPVF